jgi:quercetin dioxygenase-like cupin family protein
MLTKSGQTRLMFCAAVIVAGVAGIGVDRIILAQASGITRTELTRTNVPGSTTYEAIMGIAEIAPGAASGRHFHHGVELGYVLQGTLAVERPDGSIVTYKEGQAFKNPETEIHNAKSSGTTPVKLLAVYIVEKGKPLAEPAPPAKP